MEYAGFKPLLAVEAVLDSLRYPIYVSPKLDGIRCIVINGVPVSRNLKPIPNRFIQEKFSEYKDVLEGYDGELIVGSPKASNCFNVSSSGIMSRDGEPNFNFYVFDVVSEESYIDRTHNLSKIEHPHFVRIVPQKKVHSIEELTELESECVKLGFEGVMLRNPNGKYKYGRSTAKEQILLKMKRFEDVEGIIVGFEERMHNGNPATVDALGHTERSSHKANMIPTNTLGALQITVEGYEGIVSVGTGFDDELRSEIWNNRDSYLNKICKIKHQPSGAKNKLRFPVFLGIRHENDMS